MEKPKRLLSSVQAGLLSFPGRVGFHGISEGLVAFENILHPDLLLSPKRLRTGPGRAAGICRQTGDSCGTGQTEFGLLSLTKQGLRRDTEPALWMWSWELL